MVTIGDQIQGWLFGALRLDHRDGRFRAGQVGLWTKADSITAFGDLVIRGIPTSGDPAEGQNDGHPDRPLSVEELAAQIASGSGVQIFERAAAGSHVAPRRSDGRRDVARSGSRRGVDRELMPGRPVAVSCSYGFDVGCNVTKTLIERGFDARFVRGGLSAWSPRAARVRCGR